MLSFVKHIHYILRILLGIMIVMPFVSCSHWHEAKTTIDEADSLLAKGVIMNDTTLLARAIEALDKPITSKLAREELVKAYYLMGRNLDDYHHNFADAADYYIAADRLKTKDLILRGRINSCMGYLCKQDSCFEEALIFYERANKAFAESGNERRYANGLLSIAECQIFLQQYAIADSLLHVAVGYCIDSAYYARVCSMRGFWYYEQQLYDLALLLLETIKEYPCDVNAQCFYYYQILQSYARKNRIDLTVPYAEYIVAHCESARLLSNAYYVLIKNAELCNDPNKLAYYSYIREDKDREIQQIAKSYAQASAIFRAYILDPYPYLQWKLIFVICVLLIIIVTFCGIIYWKRTEKIAQEKMLVEAELHKWQEQMQEKLTIEEANVAAKRKIISDIVMMHAEDFLPNNEIWKDEQELYRLANSSFGFIIYRLHETYRNLNNREVKICLMVLLDFPNKKIADIACCSEDSVSTIKQRLAKKLYTSPRKLRVFLMDFIMKMA